MHADVHHAALRTSGRFACPLRERTGTRQSGRVRPYRPLRSAIVTLSGPAC